MNQPAQEWDDMSEQQQAAVKARLDAAVTDHAHLVVETDAVRQRLLRARLAGGWRTDLAERLSRR